MLYVAGEILIWMVLAGLLGLLLGWFLWGYRSKGEAEKAERETQQRVAAAQQQATLGQAQLQELLALRARDTETIARLQAVAAATDAAKATDAADTAALRHRVDRAGGAAGGLAGGAGRGRGAGGRGGGHPGGARGLAARR